MDTLVYFKSISQGMLQIFFLGTIGYILARKKIISSQGLDGLTKFLIDISFPALIFWQISTKFSFSKYPNWWVFSGSSLAIIAFGLIVGYVFSHSVKDKQTKREFISLIGFQNAGYLPLVILGYLAPKERLDEVLIYLFLFLLGFNLLIWSWGVYFLSNHKLKQFSLPSLFSPPVIATIIGFIFVFFNITRLIPEFIIQPVQMLGNCSFPLAIVVVGASLGELYVGKLYDKKLTLKLIFAKLFFLPLAGLVFLTYVQLPYLIGLLIILELAVPSATTLAIITRRNGMGEKITSQGIFLTHIISLLTLPLVLSFFNWVVFRQ